MAIKSRAPGAVPFSGNPEEVINYSARMSIQSQDRPYENASYRGVVLYSTYISENKFREKYDSSFVNYVLETLNVNSIVTTKTIIESIVYIPEICGCLPRPPAGEDIKFYRQLKKLTPLSNEEGFSKIADDSENKKELEDATRYLEMIKRYPKVYYLEESESGPGLKPHLINSTVRVRFPYSYDVHVGVVVANTGN